MFERFGFSELLIILVIALLVFGPKKLPELGRSLGKSIREFKQGMKEVTGELEERPQPAAGAQTPAAARREAPAGTRPEAGDASDGQMPAV